MAPSLQPREKRHERSSRGDGRKDWCENVYRIEVLEERKQIKKDNHVNEHPSSSRTCMNDRSITLRTLRMQVAVNSA
jgi:hypothetical protein